MFYVTKTKECRERKKKDVCLFLLLENSRPLSRSCMDVRVGLKKTECERIDAFELWCWRRFLRVPWIARLTQSILEEISPEYSLKVRKSIPRQVDKKSRGPQGERGLEFSRRKKGETSVFSSILLNLSHIFFFFFKPRTDDYTTNNSV